MGADKMERELRRRYFVTPKNYIDFVIAFQDLLYEKRTENTNLINKYTIGLDRLGEATLQVEELRGSLDIKRLEMQRKKKEREDLIMTISHQKKEAEKEEKRMKEKNDIINI